MVFLYPIQVFTCTPIEYCTSKCTKLADYDLRSEANFDIVDPNTSDGMFRLKNIRACLDVPEGTEAVADFRVAMASSERGLAVLCTGTSLILKRK